MRNFSIVFRIIIGGFFLFNVACSNGKLNAEDISLTVNLDKVLKDSVAISKDFLMGKFEYREHSEFVLVPSSMSSKEIYIQKSVLSSFKRMREAANKEGVNLIILSGTRNFREQKAIWERKWNLESSNTKDALKIALKILSYSSMPSTSRHHWGTDIDINSLEPIYFKSGKGLREYEWLKRNGPLFGFYQVYTSKKNGRTGYSEESWHWSYLPLAKEYLKHYNLMVKLKDIQGFTGSETAIGLDVIRKYVNGIEYY